jgi:thymidine kinase
VSDESAAKAQAGRIDVICGCMFAGKTARLIEWLKAEQDTGRRVVAFKHTLDNRYAPTELATHDNLRFPARSLPDAKQVEAQARSADVVGIDEAQFFGRELAAVCERLRLRGQRVIVAGIDHDTWGQPFPPLPQLKQIADHVELRHTPCRVCGAPARYSQRMMPVVNGQMVGGPREYEPRCEKCFVPLSGAVPTY